MDISRKDNLIARLTGRQNHGLHGRSCSPNHEKGMTGTKGLCRQFFCISDDGNRVAQIV